MMLARISQVTWVVGQMLMMSWLGIGQHGIIVASTIVAASCLPANWFRLHRQAHILLLILAAILFGSLAYFDAVTAHKNLNAPTLFAEFLLIVQALELMIPSRKSSTNYLPGLGTIVVALCLLAVDEVLPIKVVSTIIAGFFALLIFALRPDLPKLIIGKEHARHQARALLLMLLTAWVLGAMLNKQLLSQLPTLQTAVQELRGIELGNADRIIVDVNAKFVTGVGLDSIAARQRDNPDDPVFSAESAVDPGYVRTLSFEQFDGENWRNRWNTQRARAGDVRKVLPTSPWPSKLREFFALRDRTLQLFDLRTDQTSGDGALTKMTILVPPRRGNLVPLPVNSIYMEAKPRSARDSLFLDMHRNVFNGSVDNTRVHAYVAEQAISEESESYLDRLLVLPIQDAPFLDELSDRICAQCNTVPEKVQAIESYFLANYTYTLENEVAEASGVRSRLRTFLEDAKAAHCEYFATASTLLLRCQGVPTRLSTGYLVYELDSDNEEYIASNRNAHAWAEAYDSNAKRWYVVESTPGTNEYIAEHAHARSSQSGPLSADSAVSLSWTALGLEYLAVAKEWLMAVIYWRYRWLLLTFATAAFLIYRSLRFSGRRASNWVSAHTLHADRLAKKLGLQREMSETCHQFAVRLSQINAPAASELARWYLEFAEQRYIRHDGSHSPIPKPRLITRKPAKQELVDEG
jgi:hypothetical protein